MDTQTQSNPSRKGKAFPAKNPKISGKDAAFVLIVRWLPLYRRGSDEYPYYSNLLGNPQKEMSDLLRRCLNGSAAGRYEWAVLKDNQSNRPLRAWKAGGSEIPVAEWEGMKGHQAATADCLFKFWVLPNRNAHPQLLKYCMGNTAKGITWKSVDELAINGQTIEGPDVAIYNLLQGLRTIQGGYASVNVYDAKKPFGSKPVAVINHLGAVLFHCPVFQLEIESSTNFPPYKLGLF